MASSNFKLQALHFVLLIVVALGVRVGAAFIWEARVSPEFGFGDSLSYWTLGHAIATGEPYRYGAVDGQIFRTPGYPTILAPLFLIGGDAPPVIWARLLGAIFGTLSVIAVWWMARLLFDTRAAWIAGWVTALYPGAIATSVFVLSEAPFGLLMMLNLILWVIAARKKDVDSGMKVAVGLALATGIVAGVATLVRPSWLLFVPFAIGVWLVTELLWRLFWPENVTQKVSPVACDEPEKPVAGDEPEKPVAGDRANHNWRCRFFRTGILSVTILLGLLLALMPWWVRNFQVANRFVPTTLQTGAGLYDGLNPKADGGSDMWYVDHFIEMERQEERLDSSYLSFEERVDRRMRRAALDWARENRGRVAELAWVKFLRTWNIWPNEASLSSLPVKIVVCVTYLPVLFFAIWGAFRTFRRGFLYMICWLPALYFTTLHMLFVGSIRYRQPAMLALIVLAAGWWSLKGRGNR